MTPKAREQTAKRQYELRKRREAQGLVLLQGIWVPRDLLPAIKEQIKVMVEDYSSRGGVG
jgi:hypothetical protein